MHRYCQRESLSVHSLQIFHPSFTSAFYLDSKITMCNQNVWNSCLSANDTLTHFPSQIEGRSEMLHWMGLLSWIDVSRQLQTLSNLKVLAVQAGQLLLTIQIWFVAVSDLFPLAKKQHFLLPLRSVSRCSLKDGMHHPHLLCFRAQRSVGSVGTTVILFSLRFCHVLWAPRGLAKSN